MSGTRTSTVRSPRVVNVAAGVERGEGPTPLPDARHDTLQVLIGKWINQGHTIGAPDAPSVAILTSDVYEWAPGGFFVIHSAYGTIGETSVGGVEVIGVDGDGYHSTFYDSLGNVHTSRVEIDGDVIRWVGDRTRCVATVTDDGLTQVAHHEARTDGAHWRPSMEVTLRKVR